MLPAVSLPATMHRPTGRQLRRCRAATWFRLGNSLRPSTIANSPHRPPRVQGEDREGRDAMSKLADIPFRPPRIDAKQNGCELELDVREGNSEWLLLARRAIV